MDCDEATELHGYAFYENSAIKRVRFANVTTVGIFNFHRCENIESVDLPEATGAIGAYFCNGCKKMTSVNIPKATALEKYAFNNASIIETVDLPSVQSLGDYALHQTHALKALILRYDGGVVTRGSSVLATSSITNKTGYIYVPAALIEDYKADSQWSTHATQLRALEDYTVDGTITGKLDENKI